MACAVGLVGLLATLPSALGAGRPASPAAADPPPATPTTLPPPTTTTLPTSTIRPGAKARSTVSTRATTSTPRSRPPTAPRVADGWVNVVNDRFDSAGVPGHWRLYDGPYGSGPRNCAAPSHVWVSNGAMHLLMRHEASGRCGAGWYTGGMMVDRRFGGVDQRVTLRFRVVDGGVSGHHIIPMRFPPGSRWPQGGEEDYCEGSARTGCFTFLHYGNASTTQVLRPHVLNLRQWHTLRFERRNHVVKAYIDNLVTPVWTYRGSSTTLPDTIKQVVLQQECPSSGCPAGTTGTEDIQIDWITIDNPG
jgi:hypothetical protein